MRAGFKVIPVLHISVPAANTPPAHHRHLWHLRVLPRRQRGLLRQSRLDGPHV
jgi:hypothetical protein